MVVKHERMRQVKIKENHVNIERSEGIRLELGCNIILITAVGGIVWDRLEHYSEAERVATDNTRWDGPGQRKGIGGTSSTMDAL